MFFNEHCGGNWRCTQNGDGVEITLGTENYLFSLFCMVNSFV